MRFADKANEKSYVQVYIIADGLNEADAQNHPIVKEFQALGWEISSIEEEHGEWEVTMDRN